MNPSRLSISRTIGSATVAPSLFSVRFSKNVLRLGDRHAGHVVDAVPGQHDGGRLDGWTTSTGAFFFPPFTLAWPSTSTTGSTTDTSDLARGRRRTPVAHSVLTPGGR